MSRIDVGGTIENRVLALIVAAVGVRPDEVTRATDLRDLGADSVDLVEVVYAFEVTFHVEIDVGSIDTLRTVGDVIDLLERQVPRVSASE